MSKRMSYWEILIFALGLITATMIVYGNESPLTYTLGFLAFFGITSLCWLPQLLWRRRKGKKFRGKRASINQLICPRCKIFVEKDPGICPQCGIEL